MWCWPELGKATTNICSQLVYLSIAWRLCCFPLLSLVWLCFYTMCAVCTMCADNVSPAARHTCSIICKLVHRFANVILSGKACNTTARSTVSLDAFYDLQKKGVKRISFSLSISVCLCCRVDSQYTSSRLAALCTFSSLFIKGSFACVHCKYFTLLTLVCYLHQVHLLSSNQDIPPSWLPHIWMFCGAVV